MERGRVEEERVRGRKKAEGDNRSGLLEFVASLVHPL